MEIQQLKNKGLKVGLTNGVFDLLHDGHRALFKTIKNECDVCVVLVNSDKSTKAIKPGRPINPEDQRARKIAECPEVDFVALFDEEFPEETINLIDPDVLYKGEEYKGKPVAGARGRELRLIERVHDVSTSQLIEDRKEASPEYCHTFWSDGEFEYKHYLSIKSALKIISPNEKLILWTRNLPKSVLIDKLRREDKFEIRNIEDGLFSSEDLKNYEVLANTIEENMLRSRYTQFKAAQLSDITAWRALNAFGGIYFDLDTIWWESPWESFTINDCGFATCGIPATGMFCSKKNSEFTSAAVKHTDELLQERKLPYTSSWRMWTAFGPTALEKVIGEISEVQIFPDDSCYKCNLQNTFWPFQERESEEEILSELEGVYLVHYYGEGRKFMGEEMPNIDEEYIENSSSIYAYLARKALSPVKRDKQNKDDETISRLKFQGNKVTVDIDHLEAPLGGPEEDGIILDTKKELGTVDSGDRPFLSCVIVAWNEAEVVDRCFSSIEDIVDEWIIRIDTKTNDGTGEVMEQWLKDHGHDNYEIYYEDWEGYCDSRNEALSRASGEYVMKMDMDEVANNAINLRRVLEAGLPRIVETMNDDGGVSFPFPRVWHRSTNAEYRGRIHEFIAFQEPGKGVIQLDSNVCYFTHRSHGDPICELEEVCGELRATLDENPGDLRSMFYLGRELGRLGRHGEAVYWLKKRIEGGGWADEAAVAALYLGEEYRALREQDEAVKAFKRSFELSRGKLKESLVKAGHTLFEQKKFDEALEVYDRALELTEVPRFGLFLDTNYYKEKADQELNFRAGYCCWKKGESVENVLAALEYAKKSNLSDPRHKGNYECWIKYLKDHGVETEEVAEGV
jgi:rfaE bifunctional protein nucleotidyltransferase chain/domain